MKVPPIIELKLHIVVINIINNIHVASEVMSVDRDCMKMLE